MILGTIIIILSVVLVAVGLNCYEDYNINKTKMSFMESLDLTGLPIVTFRNNGNKLNFILDSGATMSVINEDILKDSSLKFKTSEEKGTVFGMEGNKIEVSYIDMDLNYKDLIFTERFQVIDINTAFGHITNETGVTIHGILSSEFLNKYNYVLDYKDYIAYVKPKSKIKL